MGIGSHITIKGSTLNSNFIEGSFAGGQHVVVEGNYNFAWGSGNGAAYPLKTSGHSAVAFGHQSQATGNYSFAHGSIVQDEYSTWRKPTASTTGAVTFGPNEVSGGAFSQALGMFNYNYGRASQTFGATNIVRDSACGSIAAGWTNEVYGKGNAAIGYSNFTPTALGNVALGYGVKASQRATNPYPAFGDGQVAVGMFNANNEEHASTDYQYDFVAPLHFSVGTGSADNARYNSIAIGPRSPSASSAGASSTGQAGFCGIIMQALLDSPSYTDAEASNASSHVPIGGLYRTGNIVKIRVS